MKNNPQKKFVDYEKFKEFLQSIGIAAKCYVEKSSGEPESGNRSANRKTKFFKQFFKKQKTKDRKQIFLEQNSKGSLEEYLIVPSLITKNSGYNESLQELDKKYMDEYEYVICYEFENDRCLSSSGLMDLFLVQMYTDRHWDLNLLSSAKSFKQPIEARNPGKVFSVEYNAQEVGRVAIIEEEICKEIKNDGSEFYNSRKISIFTNLADDWNKLMKRAMREACKKLKIEACPQPKVTSIPC